MVPGLQIYWNYQVPLFSTYTHEMAWYDDVAVACVVIDQRSCECEIQMSFLQFYYLWSTIPVGCILMKFYDSVCNWIEN